MGKHLAQLPETLLLLLTSIMAWAMHCSAAAAPSSAAQPRLSAVLACCRQGPCVQVPDREHGQARLWVSETGGSKWAKAGFEGSLVARWGCVHRWKYRWSSGVHPLSHLQ